MAESLQIAFYIVSPIGAFLAVATAYYAIYGQTKPCVVVYYEPNPDTASLIDLVIRNIGTGTARDIFFSAPLPILCWGIEKPDSRESKQIDHKITFLAPGKELRFNAGQYGGLKDRVQEGIGVPDYVPSSACRRSGFSPTASVASWRCRTEVRPTGVPRPLMSLRHSQVGVSAQYTFRTPLRSSKKGTDSSMLDVNYMQHAGTKNSAAQDLSDALKGKNHTVFINMNKSLASISKSLSELAEKRDDARPP